VRVSALNVGPAVPIMSVDEIGMRKGLT